METTLGGIYSAAWGTWIYAAVAAICLGNAGLSWLMAVASRQKVWSAYSAVMLLISLVTIVFALLRSPDNPFDIAILNAVTRTIFMLLALVALSINVYIISQLRKRVVMTA